MPARSIEPRFRRWPLSAAVALVLLLAMATAVGCLGKDYEPDHDIIIIKQSFDGSLEWTKTIDKGGDDKANVLIPTFDGGVLIPVNYNGLFWFSKNGELVWEKIYINPFCGGDALTQLRDGEFVWVSSGNSVACKIDRNGNIVWNKSPIKFDRLESSSVNAIIELHDSEFIVGGDSLSKLNSKGENNWSQSEATTGCGKFFSILEMSDREDILGLSQKNGLLYIIRLNPNGTILANSSLGLFDGYPTPTIRADKNGYAIQYFNASNSTMESVHLDTEANIVSRITLMNSTMPSIMTNDNGYISGIINFPDSKTNSPAGSRKISVGLKKLDSNGDEIWTVMPTTFCKPENTINIQLKNVVQTSDGGYVILGVRDNFWKC